jgi:hypothetical protein
MIKRKANTLSNNDANTTQPLNNEVQYNQPSAASATHHTPQGVFTYQLQASTRPTKKRALGQRTSSARSRSIFVDPSGALVSRNGSIIIPATTHNEHSNAFQSIIRGNATPVTTVHHQSSRGSPVSRSSHKVKLFSPLVRSSRSAIRNRRANGRFLSIRTLRRRRNARRHAHYRQTHKSKK